MSSAAWKAVCRAVLQPPSDEPPPRPTREQLRRMPLDERRRAKVAYQMRAGRFRTWVYAVTLVLLVGLFTLLVTLTG